MAKVLFLQDVWIEYYGLMQLSGLLKRHGHEIDILFASEENTLKEIEKLKPDLIAMGIKSGFPRGISSHMTNKPWDLHSCIECLSMLSKI